MKIRNKTGILTDKRIREFMSGLTNRLTKNVRFNIFARDITNGFASESLFYKFTRDIGNRFLSNVFS